MFPRMLAALAAVLILPAAAQAAPATWYVAKTGNNGNTCADSSHPCLTIGAAVTKAATGDTIDIAAGTYNESVNAAGKVLTFNGAGSDATTGTVVDGHGQGTPFILTNGGTLHALRATEDSGATVNAGSTGGSNSLTVTNSVLLADGLQSPIDAATSGGSLAVSIADSSLLQTHTVAGGGSPQGLELNGVISASLTRSTVSSLISVGVAAFAGASFSATDSTVSGTGGILVTNGTLHLYRCRLTATADEAVAVFSNTFAGSDPSTVIEDSLLQGATSGIAVTLNDAAKSSTMTIHDSTVVASAAGAVDGINTTILNGASSATTLDGTVVHAQSTDGGATRDLYASGNHSTITASFSAFSSAVAASLGAVPAAGTGSNISGDPLFANPAGGDYSLQQSSPLIDKGDQAGLTAGEKDVTGGTRVLDGDGDGTAIVDIGAFEHTYVPPATTTPPGGGTTTPPPAATDTTAPAITNVKVRNGRLRFTLSEAAKVTVTITKGKRHKRVRRFTVNGKAGLDSASFRKLAPGTYRITLRAVDAAGNKRSLSRSFKVKRRRA
jgi:hypothetical protein